MFLHEAYPLFVCNQGFYTSCFARRIYIFDQPTSMRSSALTSCHRFSSATGPAYVDNNAVACRLLALKSLIDLRLERDDLRWAVEDSVNAAAAAAAAESKPGSRKGSANNLQALADKGQRFFVHLSLRMLYYGQYDMLVLQSSMQQSDLCIQTCKRDCDLTNTRRSHGQMVLGKHSHGPVFFVDCLALCSRPLHYPVVVHPRCMA